LTDRCGQFDENCELQYVSVTRYEYFYIIIIMLSVEFTENISDVVV